jgi:hypothetical protein
MRIRHFVSGAVGLLCLVMVSVNAQADPIIVNCDQGQSLNRTLARLDKRVPATVLVKGTCTEYVQVTSFDSLLLKGKNGAKLQQPTSSPGNLLNAVLWIQSSRGVTVDGLTVEANTTANAAVGIMHGSSDIRLRNLNIIGGGIWGIVVGENSQASIAYVTAQDPGFAALGIYDSSDVHLEHSAFTSTTGSSWHVGVEVEASHVTMYATTITNMQQGMAGHNGGIIDLIFYPTYYNTGGSTDVTINNPAGTNFNGVTIQTGGSLNLNSAKLVINQAGQWWGGTTGGILLSDNATLNAGSGNLVMTGSNGQGILALNNSHATIAGVTVTGGAHAGLLATNLSSIDVASGTSLTLVGGNGVDLFCDANSIITGGANLAGVPTSQCPNVLSTETPPLP